MAKPSLQMGVTQTPKVLLFDIETAPNLSYVWGQYDQNVLGHVQESYMLSFAYKWLGEKDVHVRCLADFPGYDDDPVNDEALLEELWKLFDEADVIIGHNVDGFDIKKANTRFIAHGFDPPSAYRTVDTLKLARKKFAFNSNKLGDLGVFLKVGRKVKNGGFGLWLGCLRSDTSSWELMCKYNKQDVVLLEKVYLALRPWSDSRDHPNLNTVAGTADRCEKCLSPNRIKRGFAYTAVSRAQRYQCKDCRGYSTGAWRKVVPV